MPEFKRRPQEHDNPPVRAPWFDEGEEVQLLPRKSWGITRRAQVRAVQEVLEAAGVTHPELQRMTLSERADVLDPHDDPTLVEVLIIEQMVVSWTLKDEDGNVVPVSRESIAQLSERTEQWLIEQIDARTDAPFIPTTEVGDADAQFPAAGPRQLPAPSERRGKARVS